MRNETAGLILPTEKLIEGFRRLEAFEAQQAAAAMPVVSAETLDLASYDLILINTSAGKDSQAMLDYVVGLAEQAGVRDRLVAVHCDLGRVEWAGTRELAEEQARHYGVRFEVVERPQGDLLAHVEAHGKWPGPSTRFCTSDHKTLQVEKLMTKLVAEFNAVHQAGVRPRDRRRVRILNCLGLRAQESPKRAGMEPVSVDPATNKTVRDVTRWLPIHDWSEAQVWALIRMSGVRYHRAYDLGMPRLSCVFCFYAPEAALLVAGYHNRGLLAEYVAVERKIGHDFKHKEPLVKIQTKLEAGYTPAGAVDSSAWSQCA